MINPKNILRVFQKFRKDEQNTKNQKDYHKSLYCKEMEPRNVYQPTPHTQPKVLGETAMKKWLCVNSLRISEEEFQCP